MEEIKPTGRELIEKEEFIRVNYLYEDAEISLTVFSPDWGDKKVLKLLKKINKEELLNNIFNDVKDLAKVKL